ncbi:MAG TPA: ATP-binding cassette domain-containing protein [Conexibacter sp.]|nr:ATP-binding cassette domain-containing protein [Conexibacter sp.]
MTLVDGAPLLEVEDLGKTFASRGVLPGWRARTPVEAVKGVSFSVRRGETLGIVGESGSGKSTTICCVARLEQPTSGRVVFAGRELTGMGMRELRRARRRMSMIFQDPYGSLNPRHDVERILGEPLELRGMDGAARRTRTRELLELVGLDPACVERRPDEFSGGQRQRIGIARSIALEPELILCDEPVSSLDVSVQAQILNLLAELQEQLGLTYVFVSHDLGVVRHMADRVIVMRRGEIVEQGAIDAVYDAPSHPYTRELLAAVPELVPVGSGHDG